MRRSLLRIGLALGFVLVFAALATPAHAEEKIVRPIVKVTWEDAHGHEKEKDYFLDEPEQYNEVIQLLKEDRVVHIAKSKPVNILDLRWETALWTVVVFALLYIILSKTAWKPMLEGLQRREENIQGALTEAQKARDEAKALRESLQKELDKASDKVRDMLDAARRDAQKTADDMIAKTRAEIATERERLHHELTVAKDQALADLWSQTAQLATLVSARTIRRQMTAEDHRRIVDDTLNEMKGMAAEMRKDVWNKL